MYILQQKKVFTWEKHFIFLSKAAISKKKSETKMRQIWIQRRSAGIWFWIHKVYFVQLLWYHWKHSSSHTILFSFNSFHFSLLILSSILSNNCPKPSPPASLWFSFFFSENDIFWVVLNVKPAHFWQTIACRQERFGIAGRWMTFRIWTRWFLPGSVSGLLCWITRPHFKIYMGGDYRVLHIAKSH